MKALTDVLWDLMGGKRSWCTIMVHFPVETVLSKAAFEEEGFDEVYTGFDRVESSGGERMGEEVSVVGTIMVNAWHDGELHFFDFGEITDSSRMVYVFDGESLIRIVR